MAAVTAGRVCLTVSALGSSVGSIIADWNHTHLFNKKWPPHAKFHDGQTISMGVCLALGVVYFTWIKPGYDLNAEDQKECVRMAGVFGSMYWITGIAAYFFPNAAAVDPEFGKGFPQLPPFLTFWSFCGLGYWLEMRRLSII